MNFSVTLSNQVLDEKIGGQVLYLALFHSDAGLRTNQSGLWQEVSAVGTGYARTAVGPGSTRLWSVADAGQVENGWDVVLPVALAPWGRVTHVGLMDALTGGNCLVWMELSDVGGNAVPRDIYAGDVQRFLAGQIVVSLV